MPAICWDQWFPEAARAMVLQGAEILLYPTAIGSEPQDQGLDSLDHWKRVMQGHAGANLVSCCVCSLAIVFHVWFVMLILTWS
jgi:predicted amidohydrolase